MGPCSRFAGRGPIALPLGWAGVRAGWAAQASVERNPPTVHRRGALQWICDTGRVMPAPGELMCSGTRSPPPAMMSPVGGSLSARWAVPGPSGSWAVSKTPSRARRARSCCWHQVRVHPQRHARVGVPEVLAHGLDVLPRVQEDRRVEVPQGVHAVLARGLRTLARLRASGMTPAAARAGFHSSSLKLLRHTSAVARAGEDQPRGHRRPVRRLPRQRDLHGRERRRCAAASASATEVGQRHVPLLAALGRSEHRRAPRSA